VPKYNVIVQKVDTLDAEIQVSAEDEDEAEDKARELMTEPDSNIDWMSDDAPEYGVVKVKEVS
jgi:hypothetical protein